jgi:RNA-directed DNA polymerase
MEGTVRHSTWNGTPQGGVISPVLANMALDGLIKKLDEKYVYKRKDGSKHTNRYRINAVRYADNFIISGHSKEFLEETILPV